MIYHIISIALILFEGLLIIVSLKIVLNTNRISKDFANIFGSSKEEILILFNELKQLIELSIKRENHMLHTTFHLDEMETYIKMILEEIKQFKSYNNMGKL